MKNIDILDSWKLVKFVTDLHNHKNSIKGDFGHVKELEGLILKDLENRRIKFDYLVTIAQCIFPNNLCSNKIQEIIEMELTDKMENTLDLDISKFIRLIKCLPNYYIKNEKFCEKIKNILETYLNGYLKSQEENNNLQIEYEKNFKKKKRKKI